MSHLTLTAISIHTLNNLQVQSLHSKLGNILHQALIKRVKMGEQWVQFKFGSALNSDPT